MGFITDATVINGYILLMPRLCCRILLLPASPVSVSQTQETRHVAQSMDTPQSMDIPQSMDTHAAYGDTDSDTLQGPDYSGVIFLWQGGTRSEPVLRNERDIAIYVAGMVGGEGGRQIRYDIPPSGSGASPGGIRKLIRGGGSAARISNRTLPQDPGGGEAQLLTSSRDMAVARPVLQPTSQPIVLRSDEVGCLRCLSMRPGGEWIGQCPPSLTV